MGCRKSESLKRREASIQRPTGQADDLPGKVWPRVKVRLDCNEGAFTYTRSGTSPKGSSGICGRLSSKPAKAWRCLTLVGSPASGSKRKLLEERMRRAVSWPSRTVQGLGTGARPEKRLVGGCRASARFVIPSGENIIHLMELSDLSRGRCCGVLVSVHARRGREGLQCESVGLACLVSARPGRIREAASLTPLAPVVYKECAFCNFILGR